MELHAGVSSETAAAVKRAVEEAFVEAFGLAMYVAAGLAGMSAVAAGLVGGKAQAGRPEASGSKPGEARSTSSSV